MSINQSRDEKSEAQFRKPGRSVNYVHQKSFSGAGAAGPPPSGSLSSNRSFKKFGHNAQGGQYRVAFPSANSESRGAVPAESAVQNDALVQSSLHRSEDAPILDAPKPTELSAPRSSRAPPRAPLSQSFGASDSPSPTTLTTGDPSRGFTLQFGSISPGFMNGMQIPARTSSAPPNLDEQKHEQAHHDSFKSMPAVPVPTKLQQSRKDVDGVKQLNSVEPHPSNQAKRDAGNQIPAANPAVRTNQTSSVRNTSGMSMQMPFQQPQVHIQLSGHNAPIPSEGVKASSLQMPVPLPVGTASQVQPQVFVSSFQSNILQPQAMMHQGQGMVFAPHVGQAAPHGNLVIGMASQFSPQQPGKFGAGPRKTTIKITHPETHEELKLDKRRDSYVDAGSLGTRSHPVGHPQSQPIPFSTAHPINYYPPMQTNSYNSPSMFFQPPVTMTNTQMALGSSASRFNHPAGQGGQMLSFMSNSTHPLPASKPNFPIQGTAEPANLEKAPVANCSSSASVLVTVKPAVGSFSEKVGSTTSIRIGSPASKGLTTSVRIGSPASKGELPKLLSEPAESNLSQPTRDSKLVSESSVEELKSINEASATVVRNTEGGKNEPVRRSYSLKDPPSKKESSLSQNQHQADLSDSGKSLRWTSLEFSMESDSSQVSKSHHNREVASELIGASLAEPCIPSVLENLASSSIVGPTKAAEYKFKPALVEIGILEATSEVSQDSQLNSHDAHKTMTNGIASSSIVGPTKAAEYKFKPALVEISGGILEATSEVSQDSQLSSHDAHKTMTNGIQVMEGGPSEPSNTLSCDIDATTSENMDGAPRLDHSGSLFPGIRFAASESSKLGKQPDLVSKKVLVTDNHDKADVFMGSSVKETEQKHTIVEAVSCSPDVDRMVDNLCMSVTESSDSLHAETTSSSDSWSTGAQSDKPNQEVTVAKRTSNQEVALAEPLIQTPISSVMNGTSGGPVSAAIPGSKDWVSLEQSRPKTTAEKKKKKKELLMKADAAGTNFDLYNAYKGPEDKQAETHAITTSDSMESSSTLHLKQAFPNDIDNTEKDLMESEEDGLSKNEVDDWEDADISSPELETSESGKHNQGDRKYFDECGMGITNKRTYTRDFLLALMEQCVELPIGFEIGSDKADALMSGPGSSSDLVDHDSHPSIGRVVDRLSGGSRVDRRGGGVAEDGKWSKASGPFGVGRDPRLDVYGGGGVWSGQVGNHGIFPHMQTSGQYPVGLLSEPMQSLAPHGGIPWNNPEANRWQRAGGFQKGLIPSPQPPLKMMHKAQKKYEVGKVSDEEQAKQRRLKSILNKLTPQNFEKLFEQVKEVNIDNAVTLTGVISQIFDKALMEPTFCEMYASFCFHLAGELPDFTEDNEKINFKRLLLNKCQEEFERGEREQAEANRVEEGEMKQSEEQREKKVQARRRMLGNIRLIGELYKKKMLTERIMHECIKKLLGLSQSQDPDEEDIEALCKLMSTIGEIIDHPKAKEHMDAYFDMMSKLSINQMLSSRVRFMLKDAIDLRKNRWQQRRKVDGPKKIEEVHRDAAQERHLQTSRFSRGPSIGSSTRRGQQPMDYGARGSPMVSSGSQQMGGPGPRSFSTQLRGYGAHDVRIEERKPLEFRAPSVPLPQRSKEEDSLTLGPQGGLGRVMSTRGQQPILSKFPMAEPSPASGDVRQMGSGPNDNSSSSGLQHYNTRDGIMPRFTPDRPIVRPAYHQSNLIEQNLSVGNKDVRNPDLSRDRSRPTSPAISHVQGPLIGAQNVSPEPKMSVDQLRDMSIAAIREFYSVRNEEEVRLCIKDLKSPSFYPDMIMLWVTDSFDRKNDSDRDHLAKLLVNLCKSRDSLLSERQLIKGFESVLSILEDSITDSPKAAQYLGGIFAEVILESVIPFSEIGKLIIDGGDEPGSLRTNGLASDVLVSILEMIRRVKGDPGLKEFQMTSNLRLEDFRSLDPIKSRKLDAFI